MDTDPPFNPCFFKIKINTISGKFNGNQRNEARYNEQFLESSRRRIT